MKFVQKSENESFAPVAMRFGETEQAILSQKQIVNALAKRIQDKLPRHIELDDLRSAGYLGLVEAASRFDPQQGKTFSTFAYYRVKGAMLDSLRDEDTKTRTLRQKAKRIESASHHLSAEYGRLPTESEIARYLQISLREYQDLALALWLTNIQSMHDDVQNKFFPDEQSGSDPLLNTIPDPRWISPQEKIEKEELLLCMERAVEALPERQKKVIELYYNGDKDMTMKEIGAVLGVNESCVSKDHARALLNLKASMLEQEKCSRHAKAAPKKCDFFDVLSFLRKRA